jgi:bifunctional DNA-binding transcriptional regulator/antitoxin component of YhaV-PrlF toxin-antitoxin module
MSLESTVGIAKVGTKSLRATVPEGIVAFLEIKEGDKLEWKMEFQDKERVAVVKKKQSRTLEDELSSHRDQEKRRHRKSDPL